jgi:hypothetical protein
MNPFLRAFVPFLLILPRLSQAEALNADQMMAKAASAVDKLVPGEAYPQSCIRSYVISTQEGPSEADAQKAAGTGAEDQAELQKKMKATLKMSAAESKKAMDKIMEEEMAKLTKPKKAVTVKDIYQVTGTMSYKANGTEKTDVLVFTYPATATKAELEKHAEQIKQKFADRYCNHVVVSEVRQEKTHLIGLPASKSGSAK